MQKESRLAVCRFLRSLQDHQKPISNLLCFQSRLAVRHMKCQWKANFHLALEMAGMALCNATIVSADQGHPDHSLGMLAQKECSSNLHLVLACFVSKPPDRKKRKRPKQLASKHQHKTQEQQHTKAHFTWQQLNCSAWHCASLFPF